MSPTSMTDSIQRYAMRLGRAERLGIPSSALGVEWLRAHEHWRTVLSRPEAEDLRAQYEAAYRKARWDADAPNGDDHVPSSKAKVVGDCTADVTSARSAALPFRPAHQGSLTLEQHAAFFAELTVFPRSAEAIHARYHLQDDARRIAEHRYWASRRQADLALNARWEALFDAYTRYYASAIEGR